MATNKRKDSAALFELIDKSTLKVPKHTGSLKIPSWWSSKTNPAAPTPSLPTPPATPRPTLEPLSNANLPADPVAEAPSEMDPPSPHLFTDVPAPPAPSTPSPSIRPPAPAGGARFAPPASTNGIHANGNTAVLDTQEIPEDELPADTPLPTPAESPDAYAGLGHGKRVFAPQTMSQSDSYLGGRRPGLAGLFTTMDTQKLRLARAPMWVMVAGASAIVIVLLLLVYLVMGLSIRSRPAAPPKPAPLVDSNHQGSLPSAAPGPNRALLPQQSATSTVTPLRDTAPLRDVAPPTAPGQVFGPGAVTRSNDLYYVIIATTASETIARRNAEHLAKHGVDISIETQMGKSNRLLYKLISVKGFPSTSDAQPMRRRIVEIGHLLPEFSKTRKAWDDATVMKWSALLAAAARG